MSGVPLLVIAKNQGPPRHAHGREALRPPAESYVTEAIRAGAAMLSAAPKGSRVAEPRLVQTITAGAIGRSPILSQARRVHWCRAVFLWCGGAIDPRSPRCRA
jgi:hypothetical protein